METGKRIEELSAELRKFNRESNSRVEDQAQKTLAALEEGARKTNQATEKTLSTTRKVTQRVGSELRKSTSKALADIGESAKKTVSQAPKMAISAIDPQLGMITDTVGSMVSRSFGFIRSIGQELTGDGTQESEEHEKTQERITETKETNVEGFDKLNETIEFNFRELLAFLKGQSLQDLEREREEARDQKRLIKATKKSAGVSDAEPEDVAGSRFAIAPIFAKIKPMLLMVAKGGAIALALGGLFALFRAIKDNPVFTESIQAIKEIWEDDILPTFNRIKEVITDFIESPTFKAIQRIFSDIIEQLQNFLSRTLVNIAELFSGVFGGIGEIIEGFLTFDLKKINMGLGRIIESILGFAVNAIDNTITAILGMFGITFEGDATLFEAVGKFFSRLGESINNIIASIREWVTGKIQNFNAAVERIGGVIGDAIKGFFSGIADGIWSVITSATDWIKSKFSFDTDMIPDPKDILMDIIMAPFRILENVRDWIADKVSGLGAIVSRLIPGPLKRLLGIGDTDDDDETEEDSVARELPDRVTDLANVSRELLSGTADAVGETASNIRDSVGGFVGGLFGRGNDDEDDESVQVSDRSRRGRSRGNDSTDIESVDTPSRVAAARALERSADERSQAQQEAAATPPTQPQRSGQQGGNVNISSTNVSAGVIRNRPPASGAPDNASDAAFGLSMMP